MEKIINDAILLDGVEELPLLRRKGRRWPMQGRDGNPRRFSIFRKRALPAWTAAVCLAVLCIFLRPAPVRGEENAGIPFARRMTVEYDGHIYRRRHNVTTVLLMGIDSRGDSQAGADERGGGQVDFLRLMVLDGKNEEIRQLAIDRDTMAEITILGVLGDAAGTRVDSISLSHYFGDGRKRSCALTRDAVSGLLLGARIDYYVAMNLDGIAVLNDALGGVTVTLEEDLSSLDPAWVPGVTVTLQGRQAEAFVRSRMTVGDGTNQSRMRRQQQYIDRAAWQMAALSRKDAGFIGELLDALSPYLVTDFSLGELAAEAYAARDYAHPPVVSLAGEHKIGEDGFMQFWPDETKLREAVLALLFIQVD